MRTIYFATTNNGKVISLKRRLQKYEITVEQIALDLVEPQADDSSEVAVFKAKQAYDQLNTPVVVEDSSFHLMALNGFPGAYIKYVLKTVGAEGLVTLLRQMTNREAYFLGTLAYMDEEQHLHTFQDIYPGRLTEHYLPVVNPDAWSDLWNVFVPRDSTVPLSHLSRAQRDAIDQSLESSSRFTLLTEFIHRNN